MAGVENVRCGGKLLVGIKSMYVDDPLLFSLYMDVVMKEVKMGMGRRGENGNYLASCMQMTWFCVVSRRRT